MKKILSIIIAFVVCGQLGAQIVHSHNDYQQHTPFWEAYSHNVGSIEVDLYLRAGKEIVVCHDADKVPDAPLLEETYITPLVGLGDRAKDFILMIDLKNSAEELMKPLVDLLAKYPAVFNKGHIRVVITGSRPSPECWLNYPDYIYFDGRFSENYSPEELAKVYMISDALSNFTSWNGKGMIPTVELAKVEEAVQKAHAMGRPIRFWATSDCPNSWLVLHNLGVDIINTDKIAACTSFFSSLKNNSYTLQMPQAVYTPTYKSDGEKGTPKNVIFIIGDGMSINQITAAETANRGALSLLNMRNLGFIKTWSLNYYNTDSAGAGSALATGQKTNNRHISTLPSGESVLNASEVFSQSGKKIGIITSGDITDATPATQYAHSVERDHSDDIATWLLQSKVDFAAGANLSPFIKRKDGRNLFEELRSKGYGVITQQDSIESASKRLICIDDKIGEWTNEDNIHSLATITRQAIDKLQNDKGFYLMIEAAKIDHAGHNNNMRNTILETLKMDAAVAEALRFADTDGNTLVVVTGDHETGGLVLLGGERKTGHVSGFFTTNDHTGVMLPVFSYGVGAQNFSGVYENTEIFNKIKKLLQKK